jgi:catechol 2,3-dioxygenase-like lactoylglutathione lyase family enzyme
MSQGVAVAGLYVRDQEEALDFYVSKLGFVVHSDVRNGAFRWLTVSSPVDDSAADSTCHARSSLHSRFLQVAHQRHVTMSLGNRLLVHANQARHRHPLGPSATLHGPLHQMPRFVPCDAQQGRALLDVRRLQYVDRQHLKRKRSTKHALVLLC